MEAMVVYGDSKLRTTTFWGLLLVGIGTLILPGFLFTAFMSKLLPPSNYPLIAAIRNDRYYCYLVPLTLPLLVIVVYFHWLSMKLFKHAWIFVEQTTNNFQILYLEIDYSKTKVVAS